MSHNILTETAFFKVINDLGGKMESKSPLARMAVPI